MTINQAVSTLRNSLKEHTVTSALTDAFLWELFSSAMAEVREQELNSYNFINPSYYHTFCIELIEGTTHDCDCITEGCPGLVSKYQIPEFLSSNVKTSLSVKTLGGKTLSQVPSEELIEFYLLDEGYKNSINYIIQNRKIILPNRTNPKYLKVRAIWTDVTDWEGIQYCNDADPSSTNCDISTIDIGVTKPILQKILRACRRMLDIYLRTQEDNLPDNNATIR